MSVHGPGQWGGGEERLVPAAIAGDGEALRALWEANRRWVAAVLLAHKPREAELEDLLQEVGVQMVAKLGHVRDASSFRPWLRTVALSIARTTGRRATVRRAGWLKLARWTAHRNGEEDEVGGGCGGVARDDAAAEGRRLMDLAADLPDAYREPLLLKCVQGMSYRQIGEVMGLPETTIETRIARGRRMLREAAEAGAKAHECEGAGAGEGPAADKR